MKRVLAAILALLLTAQTTFAGAPMASNLEWHLSRVGAQNAWAQGADGHGVHILVIDTGLDAQEAGTLLTGSIVAGFTANPLHDVGSTPNPSPYVDDIGHGSFVVCEIACHGLKYGYYGIAPQAKVAMAKVFGPSGQGDMADIVAAIRWGGIHHFPIISMSLGSQASDPLLHQAVVFAQKQGSIIVAASGNAGFAVLAYPADYKHVISVGSTDRWDKRSTFSQWGDTLSITAPGDYIFSVAPMRPTLINCGGLCEWEGTSMATPLVAGALADLISAGYTRKQAETALLKGARHWPGMNRNQYGAGILDLNGALRYAHANF